MVPVGTRVIVHWEYYEYENNIELAYYGSDIFHGVVIEFDDNNAEDRRLKKDGDCLKVKIDEKGKMPNDTCYPLEKDVEIENEETLEKELIKRNARQGWIRCTDDNYPDPQLEEYIIIADWYEEENRWAFYRWGECTFGWNVLCRHEAYWRELNRPIRNKEE